MQASERGRWTWDEGQRGENGEWTERPGLVLMRDFRGLTRRHRYSLASITTTATTASSGITPAVRATAQFGGLSLSQLEERKQEEALLVTLEDVKAVAVGHISTSLLKKMKKCTAVVFDEFYRMDAMNNFLWTTLLYFDAFLAYNAASSNDNVKVPGALGEEARKALREARQKLTQAQVNLGQQYSELVTGQSHKETHHSLQGSLRVSKVHRDQHLFEVIYEFAMYVTWITFGYKDWMHIHNELGRLFKTPAFNRDMKVKGEATASFLDDMGYSMDTKSDEYLSYRVHYDRPAKGSLKELHSPALVSYFATPKERHTWAFEPPYRPVGQKKPTSLLPTSESHPEKLGVIGELMSEVDPDTLKYKKESEEEEEDDLEDLTDDFKTDSVLFEDSDNQD